MNNNTTVFTVSADCARLGLRLGAAVLRDVWVENTPESLLEEIRAETEIIRERLAAGDIRRLPEIQAIHDILRAVGVNPRTYQPACQRLAQLIVKRGQLPVVNNLVDIYNIESARTLCCLGAHDLDLLKTPITLRLLEGREHFVPLDPKMATDPLRPGEFGYVDAGGRLICRLDVMQADFSKVTTATRNVLLIVEATSSHPEGTVTEILDRLTYRIGKHCGGSSETVFLPTL